VGPCLAFFVNGVYVYKIRGMLFLLNGLRSEFIVTFSRKSLVIMSYNMVEGNIQTEWSFGVSVPRVYFKTNHGDEWALLLLGNKLSGDFLFCGAKAELGPGTPHC